MVQPDPVINDHPPPPPPPPRPLDEAYEQHQRAPPQLDEAYHEQHHQEPRPLHEADEQHEQEPPPLYEQHEQELPQQGFVPMAQPVAQPPVVNVHIHNNIGVQAPPLPPIQPPPPPPPVDTRRQYIYPQLWHTGLYDCLEDPENAIITLFCPCVTFGQVAAAIDNGTSCETSGCIYTLLALIIGMPCIISCTYRSKLRSRFALVEEPCSDCMTHCCCEYCALCQEYRELNHRGINPSAGWMRIENNQNMNQRQAMNPPPAEYMRKT